MTAESGSRSFQEIRRTVARHLGPAWRLELVRPRRRGPAGRPGCRRDDLPEGGGTPQAHCRVDKGLLDLLAVLMEQAPGLPVRRPVPEFDGEFRLGRRQCA